MATQTQPSQPHHLSHWAPRTQWKTFILTVPLLTHGEEGVGMQIPAGYTSEASKMQAGEQWQAKQRPLNFAMGPPKNGDGSIPLAGNCFEFNFA